MKICWCIVFLVFALSQMQSVDCFRPYVSNKIASNRASCVTISKKCIKYQQLSSCRTSLAATANPETVSFTNSPTIVNLNRLIGRLSWFSWWIQIVLTVVSGVILSFANTVRVGSGFTTYRFLSSGFALSSVGVFISLINSFTTWNYTRLCRRIIQGRISDNSARNLFSQYANISVGISMMGMFVTLIAAEQIVGTLASKVLGQQLFVPVVTNAASASNSLQALDIFLVQANTNTLVAHFAPMLFYNFISGQIPPTLSDNKSSESNSKK